MARRTPKPEAQFSTTLTPLRKTCQQCGNRLWVAYHCLRKVVTLQGVYQLRVVMSQCHNPACSRSHQRSHPEEEGRWALPHGEFGLDVIALIGAWRFREHRSVPQMHQRLQACGLSISEREVTHLMQRSEELVTLRVTDRERIKAQLQKQKRVILAIDGLQPDVGHEVLWVVRDCLSEEMLLARPLLSSTQGDLTAFLTEVKEELEPLKVSVTGVISDGEETLGSAVAFVFPEVPHQRCPFHSLKDAIKPFYEADRHAKTLLKKQLRGIRPLERALEEHSTPENEAIRDDCLAVRASVTDDGRSPLEASGRRLYDRLTQISDSIGRVQEKNDCRQPESRCTSYSRKACGPRRGCGPRSKTPTASWIRPKRSWPMKSKTVLSACVRGISLGLRRCERRSPPWGHWPAPSSMFVILPTTSPLGCLSALMWKACRAPTTSWSIALGWHGSMSDERPVGGEPLLAWWSVARFG
jgi:hypothetical protein